MSGFRRVVRGSCQSGNQIRRVPKHRRRGPQMYYGYEAVLHRLANLVAMATAVMVRRRLAVVRWDLIPIAIGMTETCRDIRIEATDGFGSMRNRAHHQR